MEVPASHHGSQPLRKLSYLFIKPSSHLLAANFTDELGREERSTFLSRSRGTPRHFNLLDGANNSQVPGVRRICNTKKSLTIIAFCYKQQHNSVAASCWNHQYLVGVDALHFEIKKTPQVNCNFKLKAASQKHVLIKISKYLKCNND